MEVSVEIETQKENSQLAKHIVIQIEFADIEPVSLDDDFRDRLTDNIREIFEEEIRVAREM